MITQIKDINLAPGDLIQFHNNTLVFLVMKKLDSDIDCYLVTNNRGYIFYVSRTKIDSIPEFNRYPIMGSWVFNDIEKIYDIDEFGPFDFWAMDSCCDKSIRLIPSPVREILITQLMDKKDIIKKMQALIDNLSCISPKHPELVLYKEVVTYLESITEGE